MFTAILSTPGPHLRGGLSPSDNQIPIYHNALQDLQFILRYPEVASNTGCATVDFRMKPSHQGRAQVWIV